MHRIDNDGQKPFDYLTPEKVTDQAHQYNVSEIKNSGHYYSWKYGTLNIRSGKEKQEGAKMYSVTKEISKLGLSFCCLQEVRYRGSGGAVINLNTGEKYKFLWSGQKKRRDYGVGMLIRLDKKINFSNPDFQNSRVMGMDIDVNGFKLRVVCVYSPTDCDGSRKMKDEFYRDIRKACKTQDKHRKLLILGDMNAETSIVQGKTCFNNNTIIEDKICNKTVTV